MMKTLAPYQLFFPLGLLNAMIAVGVWFVQDLGWFQSPAILIHSKLIVGGFLWSFIVGFLMTALPRMTGAFGATRLEYIFASALLLGQTLLSFQIDARYFYANQALLTLFLIIYGGRRLLQLKKPVPVFFSHVGMAMVLALTGSYYHFLGNSFMGIHLFHVGTTLLLVLGIGTRFFSFLSGLPSVFESVTSLRAKLMFHGAGVLMGVLLFLAGQGVTIAYLGITVLSLIYLFKIWQIQRPSNRPSALKYGVRIVASTIPLSFFLTWLQPLMFVTWFHLLFIGCFALITFAVATRVTLAHGSYPVDLETQSPALWFLVSFIVLAIVFRILYGFTDGMWRLSCLHLAATLWILAVISWCWAFLPKIFRPGSLAKPSC
jgi:uncharacterized protein involved in response to NO